MRKILEKEIKLALRMRRPHFFILFFSIVQLYVVTPFLPIIVARAGGRLNPPDIFSLVNSYFFTQPLGIMLFISFGYMFGVFLSEKTERTIETLLTSPIHPWHIWLSKTISIFFVSYISMVMVLLAFVTMIVIFFGFFEIPLSLLFHALLSLPLSCFLILGAIGLVELSFRGSASVNTLFVFSSLFLYFIREMIQTKITWWTSLLLISVTLIGIYVEFLFAKKVTRSRIIMSL
ncbi:MAG: hypothetical protein QXR97_05025 [Thermoproteota archaeon]